MKKLLTLITIGLTFSVYAQIPPSPGSMGVVREANAPVNLYTGIPQITVPLYTLPHHNGHSIPVFLSYHAGGHKVQDVAGPAGLGWTLHAGGQITRIVRGLPDNGTISQNAQAISEGTSDGEYDIYYFSILGRTGRFIYSPTYDKGYTIPPSNLKIEKGASET